MTQPPTILLFSSWAFGNIGDIAITPGMLRLIERHIPEARVLLVPANATEQLKAYMGDRFPCCRFVEGTFGRGHEPMAAALRQAYEQADLFLYSSGPNLAYGHEPYDGPARTEGWRSFDWNATMRAAIPIYAAMGHGLPWGTYGQSFTWFASPGDLWARNLLNQAAFLFTRESDSLNYIEQLGVNPELTGFAPDAAFAFDWRDEPRADAFLGQHGLADRSFLTVILRSAALVFTSVRQEQAHAAMLRRVIQHWIDTTGLPVLVCPETVKDIEPTGRLLYEPMPEAYRQKMVYRDQFWMPCEAQAVYARSRAMVSMDHHSIILALAAGTPVLHPRVPLAGRKGWMMRDIGLADWLFDIDQIEADELISPLMQIHQEHPAALERVDQAMRRVRPRQQTTMSVVRQQLMQAYQHRSAGGQSAAVAAAREPVAPTAIRATSD